MDELDTCRCTTWRRVADTSSSKIPERVLEDISYKDTACLLECVFERVMVSEERAKAC